MDLRYIERKQVSFRSFSQRIRSFRDSETDASRESTRTATQLQLSAVALALRVLGYSESSLV